MEEEVVGLGPPPRLIVGSKPVCTFLEGQNFGEMALYRMVEDNAKRTAWVRAVTFCHLAKLTRNAFEDILAEFPDSQVSVSIVF